MRGVRVRGALHESGAPVMPARSGAPPPAGVRAHFGTRLAAVATVLAAAALLGSSAIAAAVLAADPTASPAGGDVRTNPAAPGLVGDPLFAIAGVAIVGLLAVVLTLLAVRIAERR